MPQGPAIFQKIIKRDGNIVDFNAQKITEAIATAGKVIGEFDSEMAVRLTIREFVFNINVLTRVGFQTLFTNITMDLQSSPNFADQHVIVGARQQKEKYNEFQFKMNLLNRAFFEVMTEGYTKGHVFSFPIPIYNIGKDFNWNNPGLVLPDRFGKSIDPKCILAFLDSRKGKIEGVTTTGGEPTLQQNLLHFLKKITNKSCHYENWIRSLLSSIDG